MDKFYEIQYKNIKENDKYNEIIEKTVLKCLEIEKLLKSKLYISIVLTDSNYIKELNAKYRNIDKETDVLSFPMFEKNELEQKIKNNDFKNDDILGDMVISIPKVISQAEEYGHSFERELSYMVVHSFYHLLGYDHLKDEDKKIMREKEENVLNLLNIKK